MEDMLTGVQTAAIKSIQLSQAQDHLKSSDHGYVQVACWKCMVKAWSKCVTTFSLLGLILKRASAETATTDRLQTVHVKFGFAVCKCTQQSVCMWTFPFDYVGN